MVNKLVLFAVLIGSARSAFAFEVTLASDTSKMHVVMADYPGDRSGDSVLVAWDNVPGTMPSGALVFRRDKAPTEIRYVAPGAPFMIVDRGDKTRRAGTDVPMFDAVLDDSAHPLELHLVTDQKIDPQDLLAKYAAYEHIADSHDGKQAIQSAIAGWTTAE